MVDVSLGRHAARRLGFDGSALGRRESLRMAKPAADAQIRGQFRRSNSSPSCNPPDQAAWSFGPHESQILRHSRIIYQGSII